MIKSYELDDSFSKKLDALTLGGTPRHERITNVRDIIYGIEVLNMAEIFLGMEEINKQEKQEIKNAVILLGNTGAGKTTLYTGTAGH
jgi:flagellar biosynthesis GTPase FlhF